MTNIANELMFWLVWNPNAGPPQYRHDTLEQARKEAERMASLHQGEKFYVLHALGVAKVEVPVTYKALDDGIPF